MPKTVNPSVHAASIEGSRNTAEVNFETQRDAAAYIAALVMELRQIARASHLDKVAASLEQAYYDAFNTGNNRPAAQIRPGQNDPVGRGSEPV